VTEALKHKDLEAATDAKVAIEEAQREERSQRGGDDQEWDPRFFKLEGEDYHPRFQLPKDETDKDKLTQLVRDWVYPKGSTEPPPSQAK